MEKAIEKMNKKEATIWLIVEAILEAIKEAGTAGIPSGHLYAILCGRMNLDTYNGIIAMLTNAGKINNQNDLLTTKP